MLPDPFQAKVDYAGTEISEPYTLISLTPTSSVRRRLTAAAGEAKVMKISHTTVGKGANKRDRHLVRLESYRLVDGVEDVNQPLAIYAVLDVPAGLPVITGEENQLNTLWYRFCGLLRGAGGDAANAGVESYFFHRWHQGEV